METEKDIYSIGNCIYCGKNTGLRNGVCANCDIKSANDMPEFFQDMLNGFGNENIGKKL